MIKISSNFSFYLSITAILYHKITIYCKYLLMKFGIIRVENILLHESQNGFGEFHFEGSIEQMLKAVPFKLCKIKKCEKRGNSIIFHTENGKLALSAVSENIFRIRYTKREEFLQDNSYAVICHQTVPFETEETETEYVLNTSELKLIIQKETAQFAFYDLCGELLLEEPEKGGKHLEEYDIYMPVPDDSNIKLIHTPDGKKTLLAGGKTEYAKTAYHARLDFKFQDDEMLYGLGQQENGTLNLRGNTVYLYHANLKNPMPFFMSSNGYGIFVDEYSHMIFHDSAEESYFYCETVDEIDYYFIAGNQFDHIIDGYRMLTGSAPMLPKWAFGYMQSREAYETQKEILDIVQEFRRRRIPIDTIIMDWNSWEEGLWGQKSFDRTRFPDPKGMIDALHDLNTHFMISIWPTLSDGDNLREMKQNGFMIKGTSLYNAFDDEARKLYWKQANEGFFTYGVDAWWCDSSEPITPEWQGSWRLPAAVEYLNSLTAYKQLGNDHLTSLYPFMHAKGIYENQRMACTEKRVVNLTRAVFSGQQRFSTIIWSGDISASWETLRKQIIAGISLCASGIPYWTLDIGAFFVKKGDRWFWNGEFEEGNQDESYKELYVRWLQFGTFLPIFRSHGTDTEREPWCFGDVGNVYYETILKFIRLRYRLLPYIYSLAARVTFENYTMMRMLAFDFADDQRACSIEDQYMFGDCLMVCPVTKPNCKSRTIYFPKGKTWYDFWTNTSYEGGTSVEYDTPIDLIPLFVPGGSILPMTEGNYQSTEEMPNDRIDLHIYTGADGKFVLYQDENDTYHYEKGWFFTQELLWDDQKEKLTITKPQGNYQGKCPDIQYKITIITKN